MDLAHEFTVPASVEETWQAFNDLERVAPCFPGATLTSAQDDSFAGTVKVKLGPISMQYSGTGTWKQRDESAKRAVIEARGKDKRGNGTASATVVAQLSADGSGTAVSVRTDLKVTGKPAQFGRGVMQDVSDKLLGQFVACLSQQLSGPQEQATGATADTPGEPTGAPADAVAPSGPGVAAWSPGHPAQTPGEEPGEQAAEVQLDLLGTVLPVLARRYAAPVAGVLVTLLVLRHLRRR